MATVYIYIYSTHCFSRIAKLFLRMLGVFILLSICYNFVGKFQIITFEEFIAVALDAPRVIGIYPEIKNPVFINEHVNVSFMSLFAFSQLSKWSALSWELLGKINRSNVISENVVAVWLNWMLPSCIFLNLLRCIANWGKSEEKHFPEVFLSFLNLEEWGTTNSSQSAQRMDLTCHR